MSKKVILSICFYAISAISFAQPKSPVRCLIPNGRGAGKMSVIDTTLICVWYALNAEDIKNEKTYIDQQRLDVGKRVTKYYSDFLFCADSLSREWHKANPRAHSAPIFTPGYGKKGHVWSEYQYSDLFITDGILTEYATMPHGLERYNSYYTEAYPLQKWTIQTETQIILEYKCQKATCHWRGRDFEAWFSPDIPIKAGPWKFGGLPGLILKLQDVDGYYRFEAVQISSKSYPIYKYDFKDYYASKRESVWKYQRQFNERYAETMGAQRQTKDAFGKIVSSSNTDRTYYEQLEKE